MPNQTTNYNLTKPLETERYDIELETMGIDSTKPLSRIEDLLIRWKESFNE